MTYRERYDSYLAALEPALKACFGKERGFEFDGLLDAMDYSLTAGGKRIRPVLVLEFSRLLGGNMEIWTWNNSDAVSARKEAIATKNLIDQFMRARIELENIDVDIATLSAIETKLSKLLKESKGAPNFMKSLLEHSLDICAEINRTVSDLKEINGTVSNISKIEDIETAINKLNAIYSKSKKRFDVRKKSKLPYSVKISVIYDKLIVPLNQLLDSQKALDLNIASVAKFNWVNTKGCGIG